MNNLTDAEVDRLPRSMVRFADGCLGNLSAALKFNKIMERAFGKQEDNLPYRLPITQWIEAEAQAMDPLDSVDLWIRWTRWARWTHQHRKMLIAKGRRIAPTGVIRHPLL